jgi:CheY-like chemotaxis protein
MSAADTPAGLLLSDDLIFTSRITGTAADLGLAVKVAHTPAVLLELAARGGVKLVILDLANPGLVIADVMRQLKGSGAGPYVVAYGSHVDTATLKAAREAGCDVVLPRSKFVEELPKALLGWFTIEDRHNSPHVRPE